MHTKKAVRLPTPAFKITHLMQEKGYPYPNDEVHACL